MAVKLTVSISVVKDPEGRAGLDGSVYDVFKAVAVYFIGSNDTPSTMTGWTADYDKTSYIKKYTAYADSIAELENKLDTLNVSYFTFPPSSTSSSDSSEPVVIGG